MADPHTKPSVLSDETRALFKAARAPVPRSYPARFQAWRDYHNEHCVDWVPVTTAVAKAAFVAGWEARKRAQYSGDAS
jgi:hypothetical protein